MTDATNEVSCWISRRCRRRSIRPECIRALDRRRCLLPPPHGHTISAELRSAAANYGSVVSELTSAGWLGPSSMSMLAAAATYLGWLSATATQAEQAGTQAHAAATAYESAFAMTVPPTVVAANRAELARLMATNAFGQNTPAIAATEAHYGEMWAQDAAAMNGYASASNAATQLTPLTAPQSPTTTDGLANQAATVAQAANTPTAGPAGLLAWLGLAPNTNTSTTGLAGLMNFLDGSNGSLLGSFLNNASVANFFNSFTTSGLTQPDGNDRFDDGVRLLVPRHDRARSAGVVWACPARAASAVSAQMGQASLVRALSVPQAGRATGAAINPVVATSRLGEGAYRGVLGTTPMVMDDVGPAGMPGMPIGAMAGTHEDEFSAPTYGSILRVMGRPPAAG